jgi:hypothetical protein
MFNINKVHPTYKPSLVTYAGRIRKKFDRFYVSNIYYSRKAYKTNHSKSI